MSKYESQGFETRPMNISGGQKSVKEWESLRTAITGNKLVLNDVFSTEAGREGLSCGTCPDERCCSFVSVSALPPPLPALKFSRFDHSRHSLCLSLCASRSASHPFISTSLPTISISHFPDFAYSPSTCQPSKFLSNCQNCVRKHFFLFIYFFCSFLCCQQFQIATLLERNILVKTLAEPRQ